MSAFKNRDLENIENITWYKSRDKGSVEIKVWLVANSDFHKAVTVKLKSFSLATYYTQYTCTL